MSAWPLAAMVPISGVLGVALGGEDGLVDHDRAAHQMRLAAGLLILVQEVDGVGAAKTEIDRIDVVGQRGDDRGEVLGAERHPLPVGDLPTGAAEFEHKPEHLRVDERVVFADGCDLSITLGLIRVFAEANLPLGAVHVVAEEVRRRIDVGRFLRAGGGVDEGQLRGASWQSS